MTATTEERASAGAARILMVDDEPANLQVLREALVGLGHQLLVARSGESALELAARARPHLVLLDIMMPGIDGYETCRRLRELPETRDSKIVMVTAKAMAAERLQGYQAGADDYITKPFEEEELLDKVRVYMQLSRAEKRRASPPCRPRVDRGGWPPSGGRAAARVERSTPDLG